MVERKNIERSSHLHLTTQGEALEIERLGLKIPASCIPLGIDPEGWSSATRSDWLRGRLGGRDRGRPIVLFLSRLHPKKGVVDYLLPAFARLKCDAFLVIAGGEDSTACDYLSQIQTSIRRLSLTDKVHLLGPVSSEDRWAAFDGADIFVLPSQQENFGLVITEAMIRGCPVLVSDLALACEHVRAAQAGQVISLNYHDFSHAIDELVTNPTIRATMGFNGRSYASTYLGWDRVADSVYEMYCECVR
jgi:glycosyltransferase involved in cell wall biosynthesis